MSQVSSSQFSVVKPNTYMQLSRTTGMTVSSPAAGSALSPLFGKQKFSLFDFQHPAKIGCIAQEFLDGVHESEVWTVRALRVMATLDARLKSIFDSNKLQQLPLHRRSEWQLGFQPASFLRN
jgi:hypothetical protein